MKFIPFLKSKTLNIIITILSIFLIDLILIAFKAKTEMLVSITAIVLLSQLSLLIIEFFKKRTFYNSLLSNIKVLDKAYLVLETIEKPDFYEGELIYQALYEINKSMGENINTLKNHVEDFKDYIEMWIHEVKIPISSLVLMAHNRKNTFDKTSIEQMKRIDDYVEQVLYYVRAENAEKDYLIKKISLDKVIKNVALKNKDDLLENSIDLKVLDLNVEVFTDSKWLEFILNQIINNSIKYHRRDVQSFIKIYTELKEDRITLAIEDNGIGIKKEDLARVFDKSFTGQNGRLVAKSTGMGLFIAKNLLHKLGHDIEIESEENEFTRVKIIFGKNEFYKVIE